MADDCIYKTSEAPVSTTTAAIMFFRAAAKDFQLFQFVCGLVLRTDYLSFVAREALDGKGWEHHDPVSLAEAAPGPTTTFMRKHGQEFMQMFLARCIDNFQLYLVELTREVLQKQPSILKSKQPTVSLERVLSFSSMDEFLLDTIERKINSLAYQGFGALEEWCTDRGIPIVLPLGATDKIVEFIAARNLIVHRRGLVDERYLRMVTDSRFGLGELRKIKVDDLLDCVRLISEAVKATDEAARVKFGLMTQPFNQDQDEGQTRGPDSVGGTA